MARVFMAGELSLPAADVWARHSVQWHLVRPPLRPSPQDIQYVQQEIDAQARAGHAVRALLLGVTAELANLRWPQDSTLLAVDGSAAMLRNCWHPPRSLRALAVQGQWQQLPAGSGQFSLVMGDGSFSILPGPASVRAAIAQAARVLRPQGRLVFRSFVRLEPPESPADVLREVRSGRVGSMHVAKFRLAMALQALSPLVGVCLDDVWRAFRQAEPDSHALSLRSGWPVPEIDTIDAYRGADARYFFPTLAQLREFAGPHFVETACHFPTYEFGERCPTLVLERV